MGETDTTTNRTKRVAEYLEVDLTNEQWQCARCTETLGPANENYKRGCLVNERNPREVHPPILEDEEYSFAPDPDWVRIVEFYCPGCGTMIENEYLPPGHPITNDTQLDLEKLKEEHDG
ncbi:acetone carboxylase subunit gamma [Haloterrigena alkaliphila]|uniref:acetone carboxylase subunit gamma n=1 Tax=Haloterrigena alkaliphila TaxID=2816475 RepID=UPI001CFFF23B|nr:acetone carboxylase subunit gamma [Haloterrigena alkaliphila]UHQ95058.1 acetone carboxylase subunit gamma [Haloterrigena alkaliphila]